MSSKPSPGFDLNKRCQASGWCNNCGLNCFSHFLAEKVLSGEIAKRAKTPEYQQLLQSFQEYYNIPHKVSFDNIKEILLSYAKPPKPPNPLDVEAILAPVLRFHMGKNLWRVDEAWEGDYEYNLGSDKFEGVKIQFGRFLQGVDLEGSESAVNANRGNEKLLVIRDAYTSERELSLKQLFSEDELKKVEGELRKQYASRPAWLAIINNEKPEKILKLISESKALDANMKILSSLGNNLTPDHIAKLKQQLIQDRITFRRKEEIFAKYENMMQQFWKAEGYQNYIDWIKMAENRESVSIQELGQLGKNLGIDISLPTPTKDAEGNISFSNDDFSYLLLNGDKNKENWQLKLANLEGNHWEYEGSSQAAARDHNQYYEGNDTSHFGIRRPAESEDLEIAEEAELESEQSVQPAQVIQEIQQLVHQQKLGKTSPAYVENAATKKLRNYLGGLEGTMAAEINSSMDLPEEVEVKPGLKEQVQSDPKQWSELYRKGDWLKNIFGKDQNQLAASYEKSTGTESSTEPSKEGVPSFQLGEINRLYDIELNKGKDKNLPQSPKSSDPRIKIVEGVDALQLAASPLAAGGIVQYASQFNALESPYIEKAELKDYSGDPTQGPQGVMPCGNALLARHFGKEFNAFEHVIPDKATRDKFVKSGYVQWGNDPAQFNALLDKPVVEAAPIAHGQPASSEKRIDKLLLPIVWAKPELGDNAVLQCFTAAPPTKSYNNAGDIEIQKTIANKLVVSQYEALAKMAVVRARQTGKAVPLHLTLVGGGVFKNDSSVLRNALAAVKKIVEGENVDVYVHAFRLTPSPNDNDDEKYSKERTRQQLMGLGEDITNNPPMTRDEFFKMKSAFIESSKYKAPSKPDKPVIPKKPKKPETPAEPAESGKDRNNVRDLNKKFARVSNELTNLAHDGRQVSIENLSASSNSSSNLSSNSGLISNPTPISNSHVQPQTSAPPMTPGKTAIETQQMTGEKPMPDKKPVTEKEEPSVEPVSSSVAAFDSSPISAAKFQSMLKTSTIEIKKKIERGEKLYKDVVVNTNEQQLIQKLEIPNPRGNKDILTRAHERSTSSVHTAVTNPPGDRSIYILFDINRKMPVLSMNDNPKVTADTLLKLYQAALLEGRSFEKGNLEFSKNDKERLMQHPRYKQMEQLPESHGKNFADYVKEMRDSGTNYPLGAEFQPPKPKHMKG